LIEIQVRTLLQHVWAELSEKFSDVIDPAIKYGGGDEANQSFLIQISSFITDVEVAEVQLAQVRTQISLLTHVPDELKHMDAWDQQLNLAKHRLLSLLGKQANTILSLKGKK